MDLRPLGADDGRCCILLKSIVGTTGKFFALGYKKAMAPNLYISSAWLCLWCVFCALLLFLLSPILDCVQCHLDKFESLCL